MEELIQRICKRLSENAYTSEASISHGVVTPILRALGWDDSDPSQVIPEYTSGKGRVDFALCVNGRRPSVFIEVKGVGRSVDGDRQLFEYAFHEGVPICLLTDGRDWNFYLPSGQGSYEERRVYRLRLDERSSADSAQVLRRYLSVDRVKGGQALEDAFKDYRDVSNKREASKYLPHAWSELVSEPDDLMVDILLERAEKLSGFQPDRQQVTEFLTSLSVPARSHSIEQTPKSSVSPKEHNQPQKRSVSSSSGLVLPSASGRQVSYKLFGKSYVAPNGNQALIEILRTLCAKYPDRIPELAKAVQGNTRNHIARSVEEIYPARPDLARAAEIAPGWLVGLNIANREKAGIVQAICDVLGLRFGQDVAADFPNADG